MIKAVIFDLDGVISDTAVLHFNAFNSAVEEMLGQTVLFEDYEAVGTLPTTGRIKAMATKGMIPNEPEKFKDLYDLKQVYTYKYLGDAQADTKLQRLLINLRTENISLAVASNASCKFVNEILDRKKIQSHFKSVIGSCDVDHCKPNPEMYLETMRRLRVKPEETVIVEDSVTGIIAGYRSGAYVYRVESPEYVDDRLLDLVRGFK